VINIFCYTLIDFMAETVTRYIICTKRILVELHIVIVKNIHLYLSLNWLGIVYKLISSITNVQLHRGCPLSDIKEIFALVEVRLRKLKRKIKNWTMLDNGGKACGFTTRSTHPFASK